MIDIETHNVTAIELLLIQAYNKAHNADTWVIHTPADSTIGGFSARFISISPITHVCTLKAANDDTYTAPLYRITIRVDFSATR